MNWKTHDGQWQQRSAAEIVALAEAVASHVQACFDREAAIAGLPAAATTVEALLAIHEAEIDQGWPATN